MRAPVRDAGRRLPFHDPDPLKLMGSTPGLAATVDEVTGT